MYDWQLNSIVAFLKETSKPILKKQYENYMLKKQIYWNRIIYVIVLGAIIVAIVVVAYLRITGKYNGFLE